MIVCYTIRSFVIQINPESFTEDFSLISCQKRKKTYVKWREKYIHVQSKRSKVKTLNTTQLGSATRPQTFTKAQK